MKLFLNIFKVLYFNSMEQKPNKLSFVYDLNHEYQIVSLSFNIIQQTLFSKCTCVKENFCHHIDYVLDYIYNGYKNDYVDDVNLQIYQYQNMLWLPMSETSHTTQEVEFIDAEIQYINQIFYFYCSHCGGIHPIDKCRHFDFIIQKMIEYYEELKEKNEEINNLDLGAMIIDE